MKTNNFFVLGLLMACLALAVGCGDGGGGHPGYESPSDSSDTDTDTDVDADGGPDSSTEDTGTVLDDLDVSECDTTKTCAGMDDPEAECVANFSLGSNQAAYNGNKAVGFYGYNDHTIGAVEVPKPNPNMAEPAERVVSCDPDNNYVMPFRAEKFAVWGAGIGMDWGGPSNPACEVEGALACLQIGIDDDKFLLADAEANPLCDSEDKLICLKKGKVLKETRDLSDYKGIGFWVASTKNNNASTLTVSFPIPDTARFYGRCSEDTGRDADKCFNDFAASVTISNADADKWVYKEVMFDKLAINEYWGMQLGDLDENPIPNDQFPSTQSMGIKFQVSTPEGTELLPAEMYIDDITLLKN